MTKVFVSYARDDKVIVETIVKELQDLGLDVWIDTHAKGGTLFGSALANAMATCDCFILFISSSSIKSDGAVAKLIFPPTLSGPNKEK